MRIRPPHDDEFDAVGALVHDAYVGGGYLDADGDYQAEVADARSRIGRGLTLVAVDERPDEDAADRAGGRLLGTLVFCPPGASMRELAGDGEAEFRMLAVRPDARGHGVGTALVWACVDRSRALGMARLVLWTMPAMTEAQRLYVRLGFRRLAARDLNEPDLTLFAYGYDL